MPATTKAAIIAALASTVVKAMLKKKPKKLAEYVGVYTLKPLAGKEGLFRFEQNQDDPVRLVYNGCEFSARTFEPTDLGSIPKLLQDAKELHLKPDAFLKTYILHDYAYKFGWIWGRVVGTTRWYKIRVSRVQADTPLYVGLTAEGATIADAYTIYNAVRVGAGVAWRSHRKRIVTAGE